MDALSVLKILSDALAISLVPVTGNLSLSRPILPSFEATLTLSGSPPSETTSLSHNCTIGKIETVPVLSRSSHIRLNLTCSGKAFATVKRSCPVYQHVCMVLNLADNSIASSNYCQTIVTGSGYVHCQCGYDAAVTRNTFEALAALSGRFQLLRWDLLYPVIWMFPPLLLRDPLREMLQPNQLSSYLALYG